MNDPRPLAGETTLNASPASKIDGGREWREGWPLVLTAALGMSLATIYLASAGVVMKPLQQEFGWTRGQISAIAAIKSTVLVLLSPVLGYAVDRYGPRRVALPGVVLYAAALAAAGLTGPSLWSWYLVWTIAAFAGVMVSSTVWTAAVASRFEVQRGLALGATMAGLGLTSTIVPPLAAWALEAFGWRGMYFALAAFGLASAFPMSWFFFYEAKRLPARLGRTVEARGPPVGASFGEAVRQFRYWRLALALCVGAVAMGVFQLHLFPMITDAGFTPLQAAGYVALIGPLTMLGRIVGGALMDRIFAPYVAAFSFALPLINCLLIPQMHALPGGPLIIVVVAGLSAGVESDTIAVLASRYFGMRAYGRIYAVLAALFALGYGWAGALGGLLFDRYGDYAVVLQAMAACLILAIVLILTLGRYPSFETKENGGRP